MVLNAELYDEGLKRGIEKTVALKASMAWRDYKKNNNSKLMSIPELTERILLLGQAHPNAALFLAVLYLTCSRVGEILPYYYRGKYKDELPMKITKQGFCSRNMWSEEDSDGVEWIVFNTRNEKQSTKRPDILEDKKRGVSLEDRYRSLLKDPHKMMKLPFEEGFPEYKLLVYISDFLEDNPEYLENPEMEWFPINYKLAHRMVKKYLGLTPHNLRYLRTNHYGEIYGFDTAELQLVGGWKSVATIFNYRKSNQTSLMEKMMRMKREFRQVGNGNFTVPVKLNRSEREAKARREREQHENPQKSYSSPNRYY